jgi:hypothetical protein
MSNIRFATEKFGGVPYTMWTTGLGHHLPRRLVNEPSSVNLVKAFAADPDSNSLVSFILHTLTRDAVAALQSHPHSNVTRHLLAVEEVLRAYGTVRISEINVCAATLTSSILQYLGKDCCATRLGASHDVQQEPATPPASDSSTHSTAGLSQQQSPGDGRLDRCSVFSGPDDLPYTVKLPRLSATQRSQYRQSSATQVPLGSANLAHHPHTLPVSPYPRYLPETFGTDASRRHHSPHPEFGSPEMNIVGSRESVATHATGFEIGNEAPLFHPVPLRIVPIPSPGVMSAIDLDNDYEEGTRTVPWRSSLLYIHCLEQTFPDPWGPVVLPGSVLPLPPSCRDRAFCHVMSGVHHPRCLRIRRLMKNRYTPSSMTTN